MTKKQKIEKILSENKIRYSGISGVCPRCGRVEAAAHGCDDYYCFLKSDTKKMDRKDIDNRQAW